MLTLPTRAASKNLPNPFALRYDYTGERPHRSLLYQLAHKNSRSGTRTYAGGVRKAGCSICDETSENRIRNNLPNMFASISNVADDTTNDASVLRDEPSTTESLYYHRNQQHSVIALTDGAGAIEERYAYIAYGEPVFVSATGAVLTDSAKDNRYTYTGREWDEELSLYHFRARMYDAKSGRFCGRDPFMVPRTLQNLYAARFASRSALDPGGDDWVWPWDPNAQWWWPFDDEPNGPILDAITSALNFMCPFVQSNAATCTCCAIELLDVSSGIIGALLPREVPFLDELLNIFDCFCDNNDAWNAVCSVWNGTATISTGLQMIGNAALSCILNVIDIYKVTGVLADRIITIVELIQIRVGQGLLIQGGCNPCTVACGLRG